MKNIRYREKKEEEERRDLFWAFFGSILENISLFLFLWKIKYLEYNIDFDYFPPSLSPQVHSIKLDVRLRNATLRSTS